MGWWSAPDARGIEVADEVLDEARGFLAGFSRHYQRDLGRKPTLAELEDAIDLAFRTNADDGILADFAQMEIRQVAIKAGKRPRRIKVEPGDVFAFRLDELSFGFGRVVSLVSIGAVVEIFDCIAAQPIFDYSRIDHWLIAPTTIGTHALFEARSQGDWRVVGETAGFVPGAKYRDIRFIYDDEDDGFFTAVDVFDHEQSMGVAQGRAHGFYAVRGDQEVKDLVADALNRRGG